MNTANRIHELASYVAVKHQLSITTLNDYLDENFELVPCDEEYDDLMYVYDSYIESQQRNQTGSYYTPYPLAEQMVKMAFKDYFKGKCCIASDFFCAPYYISDASEFLQKLSELRIADIACGSGIFLIAALKVMLSYYEALQVTYDIKEIINQLYGMDIQKEPLIILKLSLFDFALSHGAVLTSFNLYHENTILSDKAWAFDMIVGNPPYVGEKGNKDLFADYKHLTGYEGRMDLFYFFIYKGYERLKDDGVLMFITTNYFITADGASKLRKFLKECVHFLRLINLDECKLFSEAKGMHNLIFSFSKENKGQTSIQIMTSTQLNDMSLLEDVTYHVEHSHLFSETENIILYEKQCYYTIIDKILSHTMVSLGQLVNINQGIVSGADKVTSAMMNKKMSDEHIERYDIHAGDPIYVFDEKPFESNYLKPFYKNSQIKSYELSMEASRWILYVKNGDLVEGDLEYEHLLPFKEVLSQRREVKNGVRDWYALQWARDYQIFEGEKIVVPQRAVSNYFAYTNKPFYSSADVYYLTNGPLKYLLGLLNSKLYYFWLYNRGKRKGQALELYGNPLSKIPIPLMDYDIIESYVEEKDFEAIDRYLYDYFELTEKEIMEVELLHNRGN